MKKFLFIVLTLVIAGLIAILAGKLLQTSTPKIENSRPKVTIKSDKKVISKTQKTVKKIEIPEKKHNTVDIKQSLIEIKKCYPQVQQRSDFPLEDVFEQLSSEGEYEDIIDFKNYHIDLPNGEKRRIQIRFDEDAQGNTFYQLKLFGVDKEHLPVPIKIDPKIAINPTDETIRSYLDQGSIQFTQYIGNRVFDDKNYISFVKENGQLQSFEVFKAGHVLKCSMDINEVSHCDCEL